MNKTKFQLEQYSDSVTQATILINNLFDEFVKIWNTNEDKKISLYRLFTGENYSKVTFSPNLMTEDGTKSLGYLEDFGYMKRIFLSEELLSEAVSYETLKEVAGHEFAHYIDSCIYGNLGHGATFKSICKVLGIENDQAAIKHSLTQAAKTSSVLEKVKKLLALSESSNMNEAQSALLKAKELMREYGITERENSTEKIYRVVLTEYKAYTAEVSTLTTLAQKISNCWILLSYQTRGTENTKVVYAHGTKTECEIASYIYDYLQKELKTQFATAKKNSESMSYGGKTSFYLGVEFEMRKKFEQQAIKATGTDIVSYDELNGNLSKELIYPTMKTRRKLVSNRISSAEAYLSGREVGKNLKIRNGLNRSNGATLQLN